MLARYKVSISHNPYNSYVYDQDYTLQTGQTQDLSAFPHSTSNFKEVIVTLSYLTQMFLPYQF